MAETFANEVLASAVQSITSWKIHPTIGNEQPKPPPPSTQTLEDRAFPIMSNGQDSPDASAESPLGTPKSAIHPTSSMEVGLGDIVQHTTQQNAPKRFTWKAPSSNGGRAAGFTYAKAIMPQINLGRQRPVSQIITEALGASSNSVRNNDGSSSRTEPHIAIAKPTATATSASTETTSKPKLSDTDTPLLASESTKASQLQKALYFTTHAKSPVTMARKIDAVDPRTPPHPIPVDPGSPTRVPDNTLMEESSNQHQPNMPKTPSESFPPEQPSSLATTPRRQSLNRPVRTSKVCTPQADRDFHPSRSKVTKSRRHSRIATTATPRVNLEDLASKRAVTEEDLLQVLLTRYNRDKQEREQIRADHATEVRELETLSRSLWGRVQDSQQRAKEQESELSTLRAQQLEYASQIKKLTDYVKGLTGDQHGLRESFAAMQRMHSAAHDSKQQLDTTLRDIRTQASSVDGRTANALRDARHELQNLAYIVQDQKTQLEKDVELLNHERERSQRLETEVAKISTTQQQSMHVFAEHANQVVQRMDALLIKTGEVQPVQMPESLDEIKAALRQCLGSLDDLRHAQDVKVENLSDLEGSMITFADAIKETVQAYHDDVKSQGNDTQGTLSELRDQLTTLTVSITKEQELNDQIQDCRTKKAAIDVKLYEADEAVKQARQQLTATEDEKRILSEKVVSLNAEAAALRSEPKESPATTARLAEIVAQNKDIHKHLTALETATEHSSSELQHKFDDHANIQLQKEGLESELREERGKLYDATKERLAMEQKAHVKFEGMRTELMHAAKFDKNQLSAEHRLASAELEEQLRRANERINKMSIQSNKQSEEQENWSIAIVEQMKVVAESRHTKEIAEKSLIEHSKTIEALIKERDELRNKDAEEKASMQELRDEFERTKKCLEEEETKRANCQRSMRLGVDDIEKKDREMREQAYRLVERNLEAQRAQDALQAAKVDHGAEIRRLNEAHEAAEAARKAEILSLRQELEMTSVEKVIPAKNSNANMSPSRPRRKADRCAVQEMEQVVEESQSQLGLDLLDIHSPQSSMEMLDDGMKYIDPKDLDSFYIPPTPDQSSQIVKKSVSFASQSSSTYLNSQYASPSRFRPSSQQTRVIEDSQDRLSPIKQPSFKAPTYPSSKNSSQGVSGSQLSFREMLPAPTAPRSALKSSNTASKRSNTEARFTTSGMEPKRNRRTSTLEQGLGPVMPDSQSPSGNIHRARRVSKVASSSKVKESKYDKRFQQELRQGTP